MSRTTQGRSEAAARAAEAQATLARLYLDPLSWPGIGVSASPPRPADRLAKNYWWQAQLLDVLVDADARDPAAGARRRIDALIRGQQLSTRHFVNDYYDDMAWMGLALLRAGHRPAAEHLWTILRDAWNDTHGGGIPWRRQQPTYKNTPANGPAAILAARLGHRDWCERIVAWMEGVLIDPDSGEVADGIDRLGDGQVDRDWRFSYNYGVALGAELELGRHATADRIAAAGLAACAPDGVLKSEGDGDGALFKAIFARYLVLLGDSAGLTVIRRTADWMWRFRDPQGRFPADPDTHRSGRVSLGAMVAGVAVTEAAARIETPG
jgi:predicted alpha-1,6-mannanase (GH76 family)